MLSISNLNVFVEKKRVLRGLNLIIKRGRLHVLMGPNGSGKSTLVQVIMGNPIYKISNLLPCRQAGKSQISKINKKKELNEISLDEKSIVKLPPEQRAKLGLFLAFQNPIAVYGVSVANLLRAVRKIERKNIGEILKFNQKLEDLCQELGMAKDFLKRAVNDNFSGGEKKKLEVLQMLILKPKYALIDEIDTGLDVDALKTAAKAIGRLQKANTGILLITHYPRILKYLKPDFVHLMIDGRIIESGGKELAERIEKEGYSSLQKII